MSKGRSVLFTRSIKPAYINQLEQVGWEVTVKPFIEIELLSKVLPQSLFQQEQAKGFVFSSKNAVLALVEQERVDQLKQKFVFAVGEKTAKVLFEYGVKSIIPEQQDAKGLAGLITKQYPEIKQCIYFCGNKRRPEFTELLISKGVKVDEKVVYNTHLKPQHLSENYDAVVFYSPSAVAAFFENNELNATATAYAIGPTTGQKLNEYFKGKIIQSSEPSTAAMIHTILKSNYV